MEFLKNNNLVKASKFKFANPKLQKIGFTIKPRPITHLILGILAFLFSLMLIFGGTTLSIYLLFFSPQPFCFLFFIILTPFTLGFIYFYRMSLRLIHKPQSLISNPKQPVLFLRSFANDAEENFLRADNKSPEELIVAGLKMLGPVVAIGLPKEEGLTLLGATRIYVDDDWQSKVEQLMKLSKVILINVDQTEGVLWEIRKAKELDAHHKLIISFIEQHESGRHEPFYRGFEKNFFDIFSTKLPEYNSKICFIIFDDNWKPSPIEIESKYDIFSQSWYLPQLRIRKALKIIFKQKKLM